jgi:hypothetical protein
MRMFWKRRERETFVGWPVVRSPLADPLEPLAAQPLTQTIEIERDVPRAVSISRVAEELRWRGEEIVELFKEVASPVGRTVLPIHLKHDGEDVFVEVETGPWSKKTVRRTLKTAAVLRNSEYSGAVLEVLGAYPVPEEVGYFCGQSPAALFQLDLVQYEDLEGAEDRAEAFRIAAGRHWALNLDYGLEGLPLAEDLLLAALEDGFQDGARAPILDALARGFGCYVGEVIRRRATQSSLWRSMMDWGKEGLVLEFPNATTDPIGKARAFLKNGPEDSTAYYVSYVLRELNG